MVHGLKYFVSKMETKALNTLRLIIGKLMNEIEESTKNTFNSEDKSDSIRMLFCAINEIDIEAYDQMY